MSLNIVFMGTPKFSVTALESLIKNKFNILKVYTQPPKKSKRGQKINPSPVEEFCTKNKVNFTNPINLNSDEELKVFKKISPDIVIVVAYGQIISKSFLKIPKLGFINIHASLLPKWRGAAPIQRAIMNGDKKIGVSIMKIKEKLDSGPILASRELQLEQGKTHGETENNLSKVGADLLIKSLNIIKNGNAEFIEQAHSKASYAKKIKKNETKINWNLDASKVLSHIHSLSPNPGAWFEFKKERVKILKAKITSVNGKTGSVLDENLSIACKSNSIQILELQRAGKNKQTAKEFLLGNKIKKNSILL
jgi:methionyl-tRNA formyltransferase